MPRIRRTSAPWPAGASHRRRRWPEAPTPSRVHDARWPRVVTDPQACASSSAEDFGQDAPRLIAACHDDISTFRETARSLPHPRKRTPPRPDPAKIRPPPRDRPRRFHRAVGTGRPGPANVRRLFVGGGPTTSTAVRISERYSALDLFGCRFSMETNGARSPPHGARDPLANAATSKSRRARDFPAIEPPSRHDPQMDTGLPISADVLVHDGLGLRGRTAIRMPGRTAGRAHIRDVLSCAQNGNPSRFSHFHFRNGSSTGGKFFLTLSPWKTVFSAPIVPDLDGCSSGTAVAVPPHSPPRGAGPPPS